MFRLELSRTTSGSGTLLKCAAEHLAKLQALSSMVAISAERDTAV